MEWIEEELGNILTLNYSKGLPVKKRIPGNIPVYGSNGIVGYHNKSLVKVEGLIVGRKGSAGNVHYSQVPFFPIDTTFFITKQDTSLDLKFLYYLLVHVDLRRILGDVGVPGLNRQMAYKEKAKFPKKQTEQKKIAHILSTVQQAIEQQEQIIVLTTELKKALMHKLFTEGLRGEPQKETEIGLVPESWEAIKLGELITKAQYGLSVKGNPEGNYPILRMTNQVSGKIIAENLQYVEVTEEDFKKFRVEKGDILFNRTNSFELVGRTAIFDIEGGFVFASYLIRLKTKIDLLNPFFLPKLSDFLKMSSILLKITGFFLCV